MADEKSLLRLVEDPSAADPMRRLLEQARRDLPEPAHLQAFASRLETTLASQLRLPTNGAPTAATRALGRGTWGKPLLVVGLGLGLGLGIHTGVVSMTGSKARNNDANVGSTAAIATKPPRQIESTSSEVIVQPPAAVPASPVPAKDEKLRTRATAEQPPSEAALLLEARNALGRDAARALRITQEHARKFPAGVLAQEREVIAIEALRRLGRTDLAQQRSADFNGKYPGSAHRSKIKQEIGNP